MLRTIRFIIQERPIASIIVVGVIVGLVVFSTCNTSSDILPNTKSILDWFRASRDHFEEAAKTAEQSPNDLGVGKAAYSTARETFSQTIVEICDALMALPGSASTEDIESKLALARAEGQKFHNWRYGNADVSMDGERGNAQATLPGVIAVISLGFQFQQMQEERNRELRTYLIYQLEQCKWDSWNEVRSR